MHYFFLRCKEYDGIYKLWMPQERQLQDYHHKKNFPPISVIYITSLMYNVIELKSN